MFDDEIVCLGSGIKSTLPHPVGTTLNQVFLSENGLTLCVAGRITRYKKELNLTFKNQIEWILHDNVGYVFPQEGNVHLTAEKRVSDWTGISMTGDEANKRIEQKSVFQLSLQHGIRPENEKYAYILVPTIKNSIEMKHYLEKKSVSIKFNNEKLQAVYHNRLKIWQMVFYAGNISFTDDEVNLSTDIPSILMLKKLEKGKYQINVADPSHLYEKIKINIKIKDTDAQTITIDLPLKEYAGQTVSVLL